MHGEVDRGRGWLSGFASLSRRSVPGVGARVGAGWGGGFGVRIYSVSRTQSISQSLALSWRVSSDVSKGEERAGTRKRKLMRDLKSGRKGGGEERTVLLASATRGQKVEMISREYR